jgi:signal transduction histidine kinase
MRESDRLDRIIEDFLRYARSSPPDLVPLNLVDLITEALSLLKSRSDFSGRTIDWNPLDASLRVYGDHDRLLQVFLNIGINALQATDPRDGRIWVTIHQGAFRDVGVTNHTMVKEETVQGVAVIVRDNGEGIDASSVGKVFMPFFTTKSQGSGLGLSVVERIIREHFGYVEIMPDPAGGTSVRVVLPAFETKEPENTRPDSQPRSSDRRRSEIIAHV